MNVRTIAGGKDAFNAVVYNVPTQSTLNWLNQNINQAREALTGIGEHIVDTAVAMYNKVNNSAVINAAKALITEYGGSVDERAIYGLNYENMHTANYMMQQYIMSNLNVQKLYNDNMCYGFEETYYNPEPGVIGADRMDYQRVMDGVVQEDSNGWMVEHFSNTDDVELSIQDQFLVLDTWDHVNAMILNDMDPTDPEGNNL